MSRTVVIQKKYDDGQFIITLELMRHTGLKRTHLGKHWPISTNCLLKINGKPVRIGEVTKHVNDPDDMNMGFRLAAFKALEHFSSKSIRGDLWKLILERFPVK